MPSIFFPALSARSYIFRASNIANNQPLVNIGVIDFRQVGGSVLVRYRYFRILF
jgi:hypothetical protein